MRSVTAAFQTAVESGTVRLARLIEIELDGITLNLTTTPYSISWDSKTWDPVDTSIVTDIGSIGEPKNTESIKCEVTLAGEPSAIVSIAFLSVKPNKALRLYYAPIDASNNVIADPDLRYVGLLDEVEFTDAGINSSLTLSYVSKLATLQEPDEKRYTHAHQAFQFDGDLGFEFLQQLQEFSVFWGKRKRRKRRRRRRDRDD